MSEWTRVDERDEDTCSGRIYMVFHIHMASSSNVRSKCSELKMSVHRILAPALPFSQQICFLSYITGQEAIELVSTIL